MYRSADGIDLTAEIAPRFTDPSGAPGRIAELHRRRSGAVTFGGPVRLKP